MFRIRTVTGLSAGVLAVAALSAAPAAADIIISNVPGNAATQSAFLEAGRIKAMGFTMPVGDDYELAHVDLHLNITNLGVVPLIRIFDNVGNLPTNSLATLINSPITTTGIQMFRAAAPAGFILEQGRTYWLVVYNTGAASMSWQANSPAILPTGLATHFGSLFSTNTGPNPPIATSTIINTYEIVGFPASSGCYPNCDGSTVEPILNIDDFTCFINEFATAQTLPPSQQVTAYANCDGSTVEPVLNIDDFTCFINSFAQGCR